MNSLECLQLNRLIASVLCLICPALSPACAHTERNTGQFEPYVERFEAYSGQYGAPVLIGAIEISIVPRSELPDGAVGHCYADSTPRIVVANDLSDWTEDETEALIFHELGHCILHRGHKDDLKSDGTHVSLMATLPPYGAYHQGQDGFLRELFTGR